MCPLARFLFFCGFILSGQLALGQTTPTAKPQTLTLNHIAVHVNNLEKSTLFYEQVLQLKKIPEPFKDGLHTWFSIGAAGQLHLIQGADANTKHNKNAHLCFHRKFYRQPGAA
jgi:lactoylglutathione lyase